MIYKLNVELGNLLSLSAITLSIHQCGYSDNYSRNSVASCHHVKGFKVGVKNQNYHPEQLDALQTHPAKCCQVKEMQKPCDHSTANLEPQGEKCQL